MINLIHKTIYFTSIVMLSLSLIGCSTMPNSGPSAQEVYEAPNSNTLDGVVLQNVDENLTKALLDKKKLPLFSKVFDTEIKPDYKVKFGDFLEIVIWEAAPSILFGASGVDLNTGTISTGKAEYLPEQMVMEDGKITVPFAGNIYVNNKSTRQIEAIIESKLQDKANRPQVLVRFAKNFASNVLVMGDLRTNLRMPITPKGERILDAIAAAGGAAQDIKNTAVQLTRGDIKAILPLEKVLTEPKENITLLTNDVITAMYQPKKFSIMGAVTTNAEIPFEVEGISLAQALVRAGGFNDTRANPSGVFIFRFEKTPVLEDLSKQPQLADGTVPTIYAIDFSNPATFFITQNFILEDGDVVYVANATTVELAKFLAVIGQVMSPFITATTFIRTLELLSE